MATMNMCFRNRCGGFSNFNPATPRRNVTGPTGPTGPAGPTGPGGATGPTGAAALGYGGLASIDGAAVTLTAGTATQIPMATEMPSLNTAYATANTITIGQTGVYQVIYTVAGDFTAAGTATAGVRVNDTEEANLTQTNTVTAGGGTIFSGSALVSLSAGDVLDLAVLSSVANTFNPGNGAGVSLTVTRVA